MSQRGPEARCQLADAERLLDIVVRAKVERLDLLRLAIARGEDDYRRLRELPDLAQDVLAVAIRQAEVEDDEVRRAGRRQPQSLSAGFGRLHLKAGGAKRNGEKPLNLRLVVDHENTGLLHAAGLGSIGDA